MNKQNKSAVILPVILLIACLIFTIGIKTSFGGCPMTEEGKWMNCHWAEQALFILGVLASISSLLAVVYPDIHGKIVAVVTVIPLSAAIIFLPGNAVRLCMMETMHCHAAMKPFALVMGIIMIIISLISIVFMKKFIKK